MSTMRAYTREFRESAVGLVLSKGLSIRKAADELGMPYHTLHGWVRAVRRSKRKPVQKVQPRTMADAEARVRELEAEVRKLMLDRDIQKRRFRKSCGWVGARFPETPIWET
jgi:transposase-like protein